MALGLLSSLAVMRSITCWTDPGGGEAGSGGLFSGPLGSVRRQGSAVVFSVMGWGASIAGFGLVVLLAGRAPDGAVTPWLLPAALCCALAGIADSISGVFRHTILQAATPDHLRGRWTRAARRLAGAVQRAGRRRAGTPRRRPG